MSEKIGYARVSTVGQDLEAQRHASVQLGVAPERIHVDHGFSGSDRERPGLREALAACSAGDELVVAKLDRLARSVPDARDILDDLTAREVRLNISGSVHDPTDPVGRLLFTVLSMIAEFEADLIRTRTREGTAVARAKGHLKGKKPKLSATRESELVALYEAGEHTSASWERGSPSPVPPCTERRRAQACPLAPALSLVARQPLPPRSRSGLAVDGCGWGDGPAVCPGARDPGPGGRWPPFGQRRRGPVGGCARPGT